MKKEYFEVIISGGTIGDHFRYTHFITDDEYFAKGYVDKFNRIISKVGKFYHDKTEEYFNNNQEDTSLFPFVEKYQDNYRENLRAYYEPVEFRTRK